MKCFLVAVAWILASFGSFGCVPTPQGPVRGPTPVAGDGSADGRGASDGSGAGQGGRAGSPGTGGSSTTPGVDGPPGSGGRGGLPDGGDGGNPTSGDAGGASTAVYNVYLGQTHAHSDLSRATHDEFPGMDLPAVGFAKAKAKGADFYFITDHVDGSGSITPADFQTIKTAAAAATDARFVAMAGIEYHLDENEVNMIGSDYDAAHKTSRRSAAAYMDYLLGKPGGTFIQFNHPLRGGEPEHKYAGYSEERDKVAALVEVLNGDDTPAAASYQKALDLGWHVGPAAGHDNHGDSWFTLATRTGVLAPSLTPDNIAEAIRQQRVYCSQDPAMKLWYQINGGIMGSTIPPAASYTISLRAEGGAKLTRIEIVSKGGTVVTTATPTATTWTATINAQPGNFYYARLTSTGGARTWTAPVWVSASGLSFDSGQ